MENGDEDLYIYFITSILMSLLARIHLSFYASKLEKQMQRVRKRETM